MKRIVFMCSCCKKSHSSISTVQSAGDLYYCSDDPACFGRFLNLNRNLHGRKAREIFENLKKSITKNV